MLYDYEKNITITKHKNGEVSIKTNSAILTSIICAMADADDKNREDGYEATADEYRKLFFTLHNKANN